MTMKNENKMSSLLMIFHSFERCLEKETECLINTTTMRNVYKNVKFFKGIIII